MPARGRIRLQRIDNIICYLTHVSLIMDQNYKINFNPIAIYFVILEDENNLLLFSIRPSFSFV